MSADVVSVIAEVIGQHYYAATVQGPMCWCGEKLSGIDAHPSHVAGVVASRLNLHEGRVTLNEHAARNGEPAQVQHRWVSEPWTTEEQQ